MQQQEAHLASRSLCTIKCLYSLALQQLLLVQQQLQGLPSPLTSTGLLSASCTRFRQMLCLLHPCYLRQPLQQLEAQLPLPSLPVLWGSNNYSSRACNEEEKAHFHRLASSLNNKECCSSMRTDCCSWRKQCEVAAGWQRVGPWTRTGMVLLVAEAGNSSKEMVQPWEC